MRGQRPDRHALDRDQLQIRTIRKTGERHLSGVIGMRAAVLARDSGLAQRLLHGFDIFARHSDVIDVKLLRHQSCMDEPRASNVHKYRRRCSIT